MSDTETATQTPDANAGGKKHKWKLSKKQQNLQAVKGTALFQKINGPCDRLWMKQAAVVESQMALRELRARHRKEEEEAIARHEKLFSEMQNAQRQYVTMLHSLAEQGINPGDHLTSMLQSEHLDQPATPASTSVVADLDVDPAMPFLLSLTAPESATAPPPPASRKRVASKSKVKTVIPPPTPTSRVAASSTKRKTVIPSAISTPTTATPTPASRTTRLSSRLNPLKPEVEHEPTPVASSSGYNLSLKLSRPATFEESDASKRPSKQMKLSEASSTGENDFIAGQDTGAST